MSVAPFQSSLMNGRQSSFSANFIGKIRDSLHNTIPYTSVEKTIIDRPEFQRLRRIHQTAFIQYIFPGATHTRFEHSLGAMHIAGLLYSALISNQQQIVTSLSRVFEQASPQSQASFVAREVQNGSILQTRTGIDCLTSSAYLAQCVRFAALLHDCGHSPLSHSGERFMPSWQALSEKMEELDLPDWLKKSFKHKISQQTDLQHSIHHEIYTLMMVAHMFQYPDEHLSAQMGQDICAVLDTSICPHPAGDLHKSNMQTLFHDIVSGEIDVDRMDYLLRDSKECGVVYGVFDVGRILDSLGFYLNLQTKQYHLAVRKSGIPAYEDYLRARLSMYHQVYFHKTENACEAMLNHLQKTHPHCTFPLEMKAYVRLTDYNVVEFFKASDPLKLETFEKFLDELFYERKLWKRVFEEIDTVQSGQKTGSQCEKVLSYLQEQNISCEIVESSTSLTRFSPRKKGGIPKHNFKVILKDVNSLGFLEPIEKHSALINQLEGELSMKRIFVARYNHHHQEVDITQLQKSISERINHESSGPP